MPTGFAKVTAAAFVGLLAVGCTDLFAPYLSARRLASDLATHHGVRVAGVRSAAGALVLRGLSARAGRTSLVVGRLRLPAPGPVPWFLPTASADPASAPVAGTIRADDVVLSDGKTTVRIKRIDVAGTTLTDADLSALLDPKSSVDLESRLRKLTATAVVVPEIAIEDTTPGLERHARLRQVLLADVKEGKAAAVSAAEASMALSDGTNAVNGTSGAIEASGVDLAQVAHVVRAPRKDDAEPIKPLFAKAVINTPRFTNVAQNAELSAGSVAATNVSGRALANPPKLPVADAGAASAAVQTTWVSDFVRSFSIGTLDADGLTSRSKPGGEDTTIAAAHARLEALGDGKLGAVSLRGFHLDGPYAKLAVGTADIGLLQLAAPNGDTGFAARPGQLELGQIAMEVTARDKPESAGPMRFTIDHMALAQKDGPSVIPASGTATLSNLAFDLAPVGTLTQTLYDMGYHRVTLAAALASSYDAGAHELTLHKLSVNEPAMGSIEFALRLANVSPGLLSPDPATAQSSAVAVLAKSIDVKLANAGLFDKAIAFKAKQDGIGVADERASQVDYLTHTLPQILGGGAGATAIGGALAKFVADPKTLHISLASKEGLGIGALGLLGDPGALLDTLDVHASADD